MFNRKVNFAAPLLLIFFTTCQEAIASCDEGQYLKNDSCVACTECDADVEVMEECTNVSDTVCAPCRTYEIPNAEGGCDFNCSHCSRENGECDRGRSCRCRNNYSGITCRTPPPPPQFTDPTEYQETERNTPAPEDEGNRVVLIICIVAASVVALVVVIGIVFFYVTCSKRSSHDSENSDESTYSSVSINSRTMLTSDTNGSLHHHHSRQMSNGHHLGTILPPPKSWNDSLASAIK